MKTYIGLTYQVNTYIISVDNYDFIGFVFSAINTVVLTTVFGGIAIYMVSRKVYTMIGQTRAQPEATSGEDPSGSPSHLPARQGGPRHYYEDVDEGAGRAKTVREIELEQNQAYWSSAVTTTKTK